MSSSFAKKDVGGMIQVVHRRDLTKQPTWADVLINDVPLGNSLMWEYESAELNADRANAEANRTDHQTMVNHRDNATGLMVSSGESADQSVDYGEGKFVRRRKVRKANKKYPTKPRENESEKSDKKNKVVQKDEEDLWRSSEEEVECQKKDDLFRVYEENDFVNDPDCSELNCCCCCSELNHDAIQLWCTEEQADAYPGPGKISWCCGMYYYHPPEQWTFPIRDVVNIYTDIHFIEKGFYKTLYERCSL